jgi:hypothetical protein
MASVTQHDLLEAINALGKEQPKRPSGKDWRTMRDLAKKEAVTIGAMRYRLALAIERGLKVERFIGSDFDPTGRLVKQTWFRLQQ